MLDNNNDYGRNGRNFVARTAILLFQRKHFIYNLRTCHCQPLIFNPFPIDTNASYPCRIAVYRGDCRTAVSFQRQPRGIEWRQNIRARKVDSTVVTYVQKVKKGFGQYIISTTRQWGKPLQNADFTVQVPSRMTLTFWSFQANSVTVKDDTTFYRSNFNSFWPEREMEVRWR